MARPCLKVIKGKGLHRRKVLIIKIVISRGIMSCQILIRSLCVVLVADELGSQGSGLLCSGGCGRLICTEGRLRVLAVTVGRGRGCPGLVRV